MKFRDHVYNIQKQAQEVLQRANAKSKSRHDKHRIPHSFQIGDGLVTSKEGVLQWSIHKDETFAIWSIQYP